MLEFCEATPCSNANATLHAGAVNFAKRTRFDGVRFDARFNTYGADPDNFTTSRTSIQALLRALEGTSLKAFIVLYPVVTQNAAWLTKQGGSVLITQRIGSNALDEMLAGHQNLIDFAHTFDVDIQWGLANEMNIGGAGSPDDAGAALKSSLITFGAEGVWDDTAFWASSTAADAWADAGLAGNPFDNGRMGCHELLDAMAAQLDFGGRSLWGPALEDEASFSVQTGATGIFRPGHTWYHAVDGFTFNSYGGHSRLGASVGAWQRLSVEDYKQLCRAHGAAVVDFYRNDPISAGKPIMCTECGASRSLVGLKTNGRPDSTELLGQYRAAALEALEGLGLYGASNFGARSEGAGTDAGQANNWYSVQANGDWTYSAAVLAARHGVQLSVSEPPPGTSSSWVGVSGEPVPATYA